MGDIRVDIVIDSKFRTLFKGTADQIREWYSIDANKEKAAMVCVGPDFQVWPIGEYLERV